MSYGRDEMQRLRSNRKLAVSFGFGPMESWSTRALALYGRGREADDSRRAAGTRSRVSGSLLRAEEERRLNNANARVLVFRDIF